jgi:acryloyl-coenzyme A reductase
MTAMMKAISLDDFGGPEVLKASSRPVSPPSAGWARIRVAFCGVCRHDLLTRSGKFPRASRPLILGHQVSGYVDSVGDNAENLNVNDRVMSMIFSGCGNCENCISGNESLCVTTPPQFLGEDYDGGYAEYVNIPASSVVHVPEKVSLEAAAIITCTLGTAWHALITRGNLKASDTVVITGASGGVGLHAVKIARLQGAHVVAVTSSELGAEGARRAGADEVIVEADRKFANSLRAKLGRKADLVLEVVGATTLRESLHAVKPGGAVVVVGNVEGNEVSIPPAYLILKEISLLGTKSCTRDELDTLLEKVANGSLSADVTEVVDFSEARNVHERMESGESTGRIILRVAGEMPKPHILEKTM